MLLIFRYVLELFRYAAGYLFQQTRLTKRNEELSQKELLPLNQNLQYTVFQHTLFSQIYFIFRKNVKIFLFGTVLFFLF